MKTNEPKLKKFVEKYNKRNRDIEKKIQENLAVISYTLIKEKKIKSNKEENNVRN